MVDAGLPLVQALQALTEQTTHKVLKEVIRDVCTKVEGGDTLAQALQKHPKVFNRLYVCMVAAGERGGLLAEILGRIATYLEDTAKLRRKVKSAMMYPAIVSVVAVLISIFLLVKVVPVFREIYAGFGAKLPGPTLFIINLSAFVQKYILVIIPIAAAIIWGIKFFLTKTPVGRNIWDYYRIRMPVFGPIAHKICLSRFARTMSSLIRAGVPILEVLQIVSQTVGNVIMEKAIKTAATDIEKGETIASSLGKHPIFPTMIIRMISAGEQTGKVDAMLERVANFLDEEIETTLSGLTSLIEPLLIVFLGIVVGGMVICMFLPIFKMSEIINVQR
jgi:type IV pilus assembly protein PilC